MIVINAILRLVTFSQHLSPQVHAGLRDAYPAPAPACRTESWAGPGSEPDTPPTSMLSQLAKKQCFIHSFAPTVERQNSVIQQPKSFTVRTQHNQVSSDYMKNNVLIEWYARRINVSCILLYYMHIRKYKANGHNTIVRKHRCSVLSVQRIQCCARWSVHLRAVC